MGTRQYAGVISGPVIRDALAFRLSADFQETDGFVDYAVDGKDADDRRDSSARGSLLYQPQMLPALRAELVLHYVENERGESAGRVNAPVSADDPEFATFDPFDLDGFHWRVKLFFIIQPLWRVVALRTATNEANEFPIFSLASSL